MGHPAEKLRRRATYADLEAVAPNKVAEFIRGTLHVMPRPAPRHAQTLEVSTLGAGGVGGKPAVYREVERVRVTPFEAIELDLSVLWA